MTILSISKSENYRIYSNIQPIIFDWILEYILIFLYLKYIRIFFDTTTINKITKDRAAKFVDMLSAIGCTTGLLTGFSIISRVEILYFIMSALWTSRRYLRDGI